MAAQQPVPDDPGMAVKMAPPALPSFAAVIAGAPVDPAAVQPLLDFIDARLDCADFRLVTVLKLLYVAGDRLEPELRDAMRRSVLGFKYWMDEPGDDGMCFWSENHQALFAVCEYLAGQLYPDAVFSNNRMTGAQRRARAEVRLRRWLTHRFRFGFTEWCSNTYYEEDAAALALLIDHADDPDLVTRASMVLDLLLLDLALHRFRGRFVGTSGRCYAEQKQHPERADVNDILAHAFGTGSEQDLDAQRISSLFVLATRYATPAALQAIAADEGTAVVRESTGLDLGEVSRHFSDPLDPETAGAFYWLMEAFTNPDSIEVTVRAFRRWHLEHNRFLAPLAPFAKATALPVVGTTKPLPLLVRALNPATQGVAIQRANIYAYRTPHFQLSSAQSYHAGEFGDQQHIWQATLPRDITCFATHPGAPMFDSAARNFSPSYWVGNGRNPEVGQHLGQLVALYDVRGRKGYLERDRQRFTHLWLPTAQLDRMVVGPDFLVGQVEDTFLGIRTLHTFHLASPDELIQRGDVTGYGITLASTEDFRDLHDFETYVEASQLSYRRGRLTFATQEGTLEARWRRGLWLDDEPVNHDFPRFDTPWVQAEREPSRVDVCAGGHHLALDWTAGTRTEQPC